MLILFYYFHYFYLIPRFYFAKRYAAYVLLLIACLFFMIFVMQIRRGFNPLPSPPFRYANAAFIGSIIIRFIVMFLLSLGIGSYNRLRQIEREKMKAELAYLKAQINPHFLFNTLNSLYALAVKKSDKAPESVTRLAGIMRYVISEAATDLVPLEKEVKYLDDYVALEKLRMTEKVKLTYEIKGELSGLRIAPLIFIPFIENAFKHGISTSEDCYIEIRLSVTDQQLFLQVKNCKPASRSFTQQSTGLGMENTRKRLDLLYPGKHSLKTEDKKDEFCIELNLTLD
jgi:LytS/YehU family sensor histidine kinase